jgi:hypothetical protein
MTNKFSHFAAATNGKYDYRRIKTLCGRYVDLMSLHFTVETKHIKNAPMCPKCAALKLIAETQVTA